MAYITTVPTEQATELLGDLYQMENKANGYVPNYTQAFSLNPQAYDAWKKLIGSVRSKMRLRRYELITFAAAKALNCSYWMLAHGAVLRKNFFSADELLAIAKDYRHAGLTDEEVTLMAFAQKVVTQPQSIHPKDMDELRQLGLTDEDILNVVVACTARSFFSKTLDALGAVPDEAYNALEPDLINALATGRPFPEMEETKV